MEETVIGRDVDWKLQTLLPSDPKELWLQTWLLIEEKEPFGRDVDWKGWICRQLEGSERTL